MKRIPPLKKQNLAIWARRKWKKEVRRRRESVKRQESIHRGRVQRETIYIEAPAVFSLTKNYESTVECLIKIKESIFTSRREGRLRPNIVIDLALIEDLQPAAAVVLAAELDRWRTALGVRLRPRDVRNWNKSVLSFLYDLGFFDLLEIDKRYLRAIIENKLPEGPRKVALPFVSDCRNDKERTDKLADELVQRVPAFKARLSEKDDMILSTALAEASLNSVQHAYKYHESIYPTKDNRWWAAASYEDEGRVVKFFVYDQGAGIPQTLPKTTVGQEIIKIFGGKITEPSSFASDSKLIWHVLTTKVSSTGKSYRGRGFPQIVAAASARGGRLRVLSGKGSAIYQHDVGATALSDNRHHLGGTLLEWAFRLDQM